MLKLVAVCVPKTNPHVCTSMLLNMLLYVIEKAPCWLGEGAVAAHRKDDVSFFPQNFAFLKLVQTGRNGTDLLLN